MSTVYHASIPVDLAALSRQRLGAAQFYYGDNDSHIFTALVADSADPDAGLRAGTVSGTALRADGVTVPLEGEKGEAVETVTFPDGRQAQATPCSVTLPQAAFAVPGALQISIKLTSGTTATTVLSITGTVIRTETDSAVDPGEIIPDLASLQAAAGEALGAAGDARDAADAVDSALSTLSTIFPPDAKMALLTCLSKVAWTDEHGQDYYDALEAALFPEVYVTGITCTYTQTVDVLDTDPLDVIRPDLVVTANLSNGLTQVVQNYTLVGVLAAGESPVTAIYGSFSDTFDVTVVGLPSGYTKYDYIQNTTIDGTGGHPENYCIDTKLNSLYCDTRYIHELTFLYGTNPVSTSNTGGVFGSRPTSGDAGSAAGVNLWFSKSYTNKIALGYNGAVSGPVIDAAWGVKHSLKLEAGNIIVDGVIAKTQSAARENYDTATLWLFGISAPVLSAASGGLFRVQIFSYRLTDSVTGEVISEMVPCTNPNSVPGMYDKIRHSFHSSVTVENFSCGNEV